MVRSVVEDKRSPLFFSLCSFPKLFIDGVERSQGQDPKSVESSLAAQQVRSTKCRRRRVDAVFILMDVGRPQVR